MSYVIDRRLNGKNKSTVNRQRFLRRYREHIKKAVEEAVSRRSITDMEHGEQISIPGRDIDEPVLHHGRGGKQTTVHPGNKEFTAGEHIARPQGGGGGGGGKGKAGNSGEGMDEFVFQITQEEFLEFMFEDLELPNLVKRHLTGADTFKTVRAGVASEGNPSRINIVRTLRSAHARRIALTGSSRALLRAAQKELERLRVEEPANFTDIQEVEAEIVRLKARINRLPFLDTFDLKYNLLVKQPNPSSKAVMFCLMDVSGSMTQATKDIAKRFFILLYLFLKRNYERIEVVFIRHHTSAREVDEEEFFYSRETGGTIVSSALKLMQEIMAARYPASDWNIYAAQASDGDNWNDDSPICRDILTRQIMPHVQYYTYVEITPREHQALWYEYERIGETFPDTFAQQQLVSAGDIYPVFRELFQRRLAT
ncbi:YeaH/YhbH family protein [Pseudomonas sp. S75]|uniref:YeaH/YhbH family protein n=1 Tax=unclassified Pseudomonas TaxID=196821 RepID=UPI001903F13F|nr:MULTISPECIES: YeaH/YhbH family protein [unclassified Pseudomonas]MBJ9976964.1 YeaH/YhbH family protein [Pseudomonas sp. S30]MBK0154040.1 YeaH/YhbH family protein [Pseudomonas sp. S75]